MTTSFGDTQYKVRSTDPQDLIFECNRIFELISDRLDKIEGLRGSPQFYGDVYNGYDTVHTDSTKGLVLKDAGTPPHYWRVTIDSTGTLVQTDLGRVPS
jgi:hypothetical protein